MPVHEYRAPEPLALLFEREGEPPVRVEVPDGAKAAIKAVTLILTHKLRAGDRLSVLKAE